MSLAYLDPGNLEADLQMGACTFSSCDLSLFSTRLSLHRFWVPTHLGAVVVHGRRSSSADTCGPPGCDIRVELGPDVPPRVSAVPINGAVDHDRNRHHWIRYPRGSFIDARRGSLSRCYHHHRHVLHFHHANMLSLDIEHQRRAFAIRCLCRCSGPRSPSIFCVR